MLTNALQSSAISGGQVIAALITGLFLLAIGVANVVVTMWQGHVTRSAAKRLADREQWWDRFTWAAEALFSSHEKRALVAVSVLNALAAVEWIHRDDEEMIFAVFDQLNAEYYEQDVEADSNAEDH